MGKIENRDQTIGFLKVDERLVLYPLTLLSFLTTLFIMAVVVFDWRFPLLIYYPLVMGFPFCVLFQCILILLWNFFPKKWVRIDKPGVLFPLTLLSLVILFFMGVVVFGLNLPISPEKELLITSFWFYSELLQSILILLWNFTPKKGISIDKPWVLFPLTLLSQVALFTMVLWVSNRNWPSNRYGELPELMFLVWIFSFQSQCALILLSNFIPKKTISLDKPWILFPLTLLTLATQFIMGAWVFPGNLLSLQVIDQVLTPVLVICAFFQFSLILLWNFIPKKEIPIKDETLSKTFPKQEVISLAFENRNHPVAGPWVLYPLTLLSLAILFIMGGWFIIGEGFFGGDFPHSQEIARLLTKGLIFCAIVQCTLILRWYFIFKKGNSIRVEDLSLSLHKEEGRSQTRENPHPEHQTLMFMALLQEKGRLVDFIMEDISQHSDEQVSTACRVVHQGCKDVILEAFEPVPVSSQEENTSLTLEEGFSPREYKIVGNIDRKPPFSGILLHKGWRASKINLPKPARVAAFTENPVIIPAEIEVS